MLAIRDWEETPVQTQGNAQGTPVNVLFARNLPLAKE